MKRTTVKPSLTPDPRLVTLSTIAPETTEMAFLEVQGVEAQQDAQDPSKRELWGLALPYGEVMDRFHPWTGARRQVFEANSAELDPNGAKAYYGHDHLDRGMPIGRLLVGEQTPQGLKIGMRLSKTAKADEVWALAQPDEDGVAVLDRFSVGYLEQEYVLEDADTEDPLVRHTKVLVKETSVVPDPQYPSARIEQVLANRTTPPTPKEGTPMTEAQRRRLAALTAQTTLSQAEEAEKATLTALAQANPVPPNGPTQEDFQGLSQGLDNLERRIATLGDLSALSGSNGVPAEFAAFDSYGHFLQAAATNQPEAMALLAYVGGVVGDLGDWVKDSWVGDLYRPLQERRRVTNLFTQRPLPATGMGVEFGRLNSDTTQVAEQVNEGDLLAYGKIDFTTDRAPLKTYGGWGEMSRQEIERSSMAIVEKFFAALLQRYARVTEAAVRAAALDPANGVELPGAVIPDLATTVGWTDLILDAAFYMDDNGLVPEFALVDRATFKSAAHIQVGPDGDYFLNRTTGKIDVKGLSGEVFNVALIPVVAPANTVRICAPEGLATFEAAGAPFRLQDDDITHLTKAFSVYGYQAVADEDHNAIVRPQVA